MNSKRITAKAITNTPYSSLWVRVSLTVLFLFSLILLLP